MDDTTGQPPNGTATGHDRTERDGATGHDIDSVARALGVTPDAVRKRIARGQLAARKVGGRWLVAWPDAGHDGNGTTRPTGSDATGTGHDGSATRRDHDRTGHDRLLALVESLTARTERLENERAELYGRLGFLQAQLQAKDEQVKALMAPTEPEPAPEPPPTIAPRWPEEPAAPEPARPWWRFWGAG